MYCVFFCKAINLHTISMRYVSMCNITSLIDELGSICIDIHLDARRGSYNWQFGPCHSSHQYFGSGTYTEKCCAPNGDYIFSCKDTKGDGWVNSVVKIGSHQFCDDIVGYEKLLAIDISGTIVKKFPTNLILNKYHYENLLVIFSSSL